MLGGKPSQVVGLLVGAWSLLAAGCAEEFHGRPPLQKGVHFPIGLAVDADNHALLIVNSDFDLAHESASVVAVDTTTHRFLDTFAATAPFPGELVLYQPPDGDGLFAYLPVRGDNSITWLSAGKSGGEYVLTCNDDEDPGQPECTGTHVYVEGALSVEDDEGLVSLEDATLGSDPMALAILPGREGEPDRLVVAAMRAGTVSLLDIQDTGEPKLVAQYQASQGVNAIVVEPGTRRIYVASKYNSLLYKLSVADTQQGPDLQLERIITLPAPFQTADYGRGMALAGRGRYVLISYRTPASLLVVETGDETDTYEQAAVRSVPVGRQPGQVRVFASGPGGREMAYVMCFGDDRVWAVDVESLLPAAPIEVGKGPYDMAVLQGEDGQRGYVSNFVGHTVSVIDLDPGSPYHNMQIAEIH